MMATTMALQRTWQGPALFSYGFRPFFFFGALHAALMVALWVPWYLGFLSIPSAFPPVVWHSHELLFGYVPAIVAGFLLTAVPNWTGRLPVVGWPLAGLFALWLLGRLSVALSLHLSPLAVALLSLAFPAALLGTLGREIVAGRNWRNLKVVAGVAVLMLAQALFHHEIWRYGRSTYGDHLAVAATLTLIMIVGGRIVPSFTINWLKQNNPGPLPTPFSRFDMITMVVGVAALAGWVAAPAVPSLNLGLASLLALAGFLQAARQWRWRPERTLAEPLVTVLHVGYAFVPVGFLLAACALWSGTTPVATGAAHAWTVGAIGMMTLAVMTRATRGHSGRALTAPTGTVAIYALVLAAALCRIAAALMPETAFVALGLAGLAWTGAFFGFALLYAPMLLLPRRDR
jgi:uncharacterized protein involved in response to NO